MPKLASVSVYMTSEKKAHLQARAEKNHRSVAAEIMDMVEKLEAVEAHSQAKAPGKAA